MKKIPIKCTAGIKWIEAVRIIYFETHGNHTKIFLSDKKQILSTATLKHYSTMLHLNGFYRINHKHLVNKDFILEYNPGQRIVLLTCKTKLEASFRKKTGLLDFMYK